MCHVFEAEHVTLRQGVAVKVLKPELAKDPDCVARFEREARASAQLRSVNVARVFDVDWAPTGQPYMTMELLAGRDLGTELTESGRLPIPLAVDYVRQACSGIAEAHALGIVHRDLKPENLFLTDLGELTDRKLVKILDFGIAKDVTEESRRLTAPDSVFGTVDYMSPEQIRSAAKVDHRSDIWSLGIILYELLTGRLPYTGDARSAIAQIVSDPIVRPDKIVSAIPPSLVETVMKALEKDPAKRFQSAEELREALEGYSDLDPITSVIAKLPPQSAPKRSERSIPPPAAVGSVPPPRDQRTHGAWETKQPSRRGWGKVWLALPLFAIVGGGALFAYRHSMIGGAVAAPSTTPVPATSAPPVTSLTSMTSGTPPAATSAPPPTIASDDPDPAPVPAPASSGSTKPTKSPKPPPARPKPHTAAPPPTPTGPPRHL
jgi:eukaryotic-like serine/threonine-protein kinase